MKARNSILLSLLIVFGLISLILFLTISDSRLETELFWAAFIISIPFNFLVACAWTLWAYAKSGKAITRITAVTAAVIFFTALILVFGLVLMIAPFEGFTFPLIAYAVIFAAYIIVMLYMKGGAKYIEKVEKPQLFTKVLEATVLDCLARSTDPATQKALQTLAENVRFSDPVSHESLKDVEGRLSTLVYEISADISINSEADLTHKIAAADAMLASRNNHCKILKQCR